MLPEPQRTQLLYEMVVFRNWLANTPGKKAKSKPKRQTASGKAKLSKQEKRRQAREIQARLEGARPLPGV